MSFVQPDPSLLAPGAMPALSARSVLALPLLLLTGCLASGGVGEGDPFTRGGAGGAGAPAASDPDAPETLSLTGSVVAGADLTPLAGARIVLEPTEGGSTFRASSDSLGAFELAEVPVGSYTATASVDGYRTADTRLDVRGVPPVRILIQLAGVDEAEESSEITLEGGYDPLAEAGYYYRKDRETGSFLEAADIRRRGSGTPSELILSLAGFRSTPQSGGQLVVGRRGCPPTLFIDGLEVGDLRQVNMLVSIPLIAAIEAYPSSSPPAIFAGLNVLCGAVAVWTQRGRGPS